MKRYLKIFLLGVLLIPLEKTWAKPRFDVNDLWERVKISMPSGRRPLAEMLKVYSHSAQANIFANVNGVSVNVPIDSPADFVASGVVFPHSRRMSIGRIAFQGGMWPERNTLDTYVLWPRPDLGILTKLILAQQQKFDEINPPGDRTATIAALKNFFKQQKGWNPDAQTVAEKNLRAHGVAGVLQLADFPPALRGPLLSEMNLQLRTLNVTLGPIIWTDDYWKNVRVSLRVPLRTRDGKLKPNPYTVPQVDLLLPPNREPINRGLPVGHPQQIKVNWQRPEGPTPARLVSRPSFRRSPLCAPADEPVPAPLPFAAVTEPEFTFDPAGEAALQKTILLAQQSASPAVILADMSHQSGVALQIDTDVAPDAKTIALSEGMTLSAAMQALARLYSGHWEKQGEGYILRSDHLDELHTLMAQMGESAFYRFMLRSDEESQQIGDDLAGQIVDACDLKQLESEEGVVFSSLPADLQQSIMTFIRENHIGSLIVSQQRVDDALATNFQFRFAPLPERSPQFFGAFYTGGDELGGSGNSSILAAYTPDGRYITRLFPEFAGAGPFPWEEAQEKRDLADQAAFQQWKQQHNAQ